MVRYPREQRRSLSDFEEIRIRTGDGSERPLMELAEVKNDRSYAEINRIEQMRSITVTADVDDTKGNAREIVGLMQKEFMPDLLKKYPGVRVRWEGQQEDTMESMGSLFKGLGVALFAMYCLLTLEFRSYIQPLIILLAIPFGWMGAIWGHAILGLPLTIFTVFGLVSLTGVVVNDSIVLVDFINRRVRRGVPLRKGLLEAGRRRFRPVLLTSVTTVAGLTPLLLERSFQAQVLIPMAASLSFGLVASTAVVLLLVPTLYSVYARVCGVTFELIDEPEYDKPVHAQSAVVAKVVDSGE
jgi:multidrug efflux pump subunit AcrB